MIKVRAAWFLIVLAGLVLFGWLSIQVYRSQIDPEGFRGVQGAFDGLRARGEPDQTTELGPGGAGQGSEKLFELDRAGWREVAELEG